VEEYLETLWMAEEAAKPIAKVSWVANRLHVAPPSVVEMFKKLAEQGLVTYYPYRGVKLREAGRTIAQRVIRNHRLVEVLMKTTLITPLDEDVACGLEHHMTEVFTNALCTLLDHPRLCPHRHPIPPGNCCTR
jgi:DtxR family Mn-dependent transcriptional regulator